ncbi:hypothetical protein B0H13DRAFT_2043864 [Mycena leptocephala]|nr:hypothetical protein B0H13DRAFT_2043864 [Mycena leptocephala]
MRQRISLVSLTYLRWSSVFTICGFPFTASSLSRPAAGRPVLVRHEISFSFTHLSHWSLIPFRGRLPTSPVLSCSTPTLFKSLPLHCFPHSMGHRLSG